MKSRFVKKLIAASLVTAMSVSMVACGENTDDAPQSSTSSEESDDSEKYTVITDDEGNPIDLGGIEVVIRDWWTPSEEEEPNNAYEEARQNIATGFRKRITLRSKKWLFPTGVQLLKIS